jgi:hypothetical protein
MGFKLKSLQERINKLTQLPSSLSKSLERLNSLQENHLNKKKSLSDRELDIPKIDVPEHQSMDSNFKVDMNNYHQAFKSDRDNYLQAIISDVDNYNQDIRNEQISRENELRDRHDEIVTMQANIVDAINETVSYQTKLSKSSNRVQYAILVISALNFIIALLVFF